MENNINYKEQQILELIKAFKEGNKIISSFTYEKEFLFIQFSGYALVINSNGTWFLEGTDGG